MAYYKIFKNGEEMNTIVASIAFAESYCAKNGYTYEEIVLVEEEVAEPLPTIEERVTTLEESNAEMTEALDMILNGVVE